MSQTPITVDYPIAEILKEINSKLDKMDEKFESQLDDLDKKFESKFEKMEGKLDKIEERLTNVEIGQAKLTEKVEGIDSRLKKVEGTQTSQVWALIVLVAGAILTTGFKTFFGGNP